MVRFATLSELGTGEGGMGADDKGLVKWSMGTQRVRRGSGETWGEGVEGVNVGAQMWTESIVLAILPLTRT